MPEQADSGGPSTDRGSVRLIVLALLLVLGLLAFFYLRTAANADYLTQRNMRVLGRLSQRIEAEVNNTQSILANYAATPEKRRKVDEIEVIRLGGVDRSAEIPECSRSRMAPLWVDPATATLQRRCRGAPTSKDEVPVYQYQRDLAGWFLPLLRTELFDEIFLADATGRVLLQSEETGLRMQVLPPLADAEAEESAATDARGRRLPSPLSTAEVVRIAGRKQRLFSQPIRLAAPRPKGLEGDDQPASNDWIIGGLVSSSRFRVESLALDPTEVLALTLLVVFAVVAWPFVKLGTLGPRDKISARDLLFQGFSLLLGGGLMALCLVDLAYYPNLKRTIDQQLHEIGDRITGNLGEEIDRALRQLLSLSEELPGGPAFPALLKTGLLKPGSDTPLESYPFLDMVFWTDRDGEQFDKWTVKREVTPLVNVGHRDYVEEVKDGRSWERRLDDRDIRYFQEAILSVNTGERLTALSTPVQKAGRQLVAVLITRLLALDEPVLPTGFELAVIQADGEVVYHSAPGRSLGENLFVESDRSPSLRSVVASRSAETLTLRYLGRDVRARVQPIATTPWSLVVLFDKAVSRSINLETLILAFALLAAYAALLLAVYASLTYGGGLRRFRWVWPDRDHSSKYVLLICGLGLYAAELLRQTVADTPRSILPSAFLLPVQAAGFALLILAAVPGRWRRCRRCGWGLLAGATLALVAIHTTSGSVSGALGALVIAGVATGLVGWHRRRDLRGWPGAAWFDAVYLGSIVSGLLVFALLPAALFFRIVYFDHLMLFVKHAQLEVAHGLTERLQRVRDQYRWSEAGPDTLLPASFQDQRLGEELDLAFQPFFQTCFEPPGEEWRCPPTASSPEELDPVAPGRSARIQPALWKAYPFLTDFSVAARHLFELQSDDREWTWSIGKPLPGRSVKPLLLSTRPDLESPGYRVYSEVPIDLVWPTLLWWGLLPVAAGVVLVGVVRTVAGRIFLLDLPAPSGVAGALGEAELAEWKSSIEARFGERPLERVRSNLGVLESECAWRASLREAASAIAGEAEFPELDRAAVIDRVGEAGADELRSVWEALEQTERMLLAQLEYGAIVNPKSRQTLRRLLRLGLLVRDPGLRPVSESLGRFVRSRIGPEDLTRWETTGSMSLWRQLRQPLFFVLIALAVLLFATQRQLFNETMAMISAVTVGVPALFRLLGLLRQTSDGGSGAA